MQRRCFEEALEDIQAKLRVKRFARRFTIAMQAKTRLFGKKCTEDERRTRNTSHGSAVCCPSIQRDARIAERSTVFVMGGVWSVSERAIPFPRHTLSVQSQFEAIACCAEGVRQGQRR